jgi:hypothetical protein
VVFDFQGPQGGLRYVVLYTAATTQVGHVRGAATQQLEVELPNAAPISKTVAPVTRHLGERCYPPDIEPA